MNTYKQAFDDMFGDRHTLTGETRIGFFDLPASFFRIRTTHPSDDSGVALLSRHFESQDTVDEAEAMRKYGIGRLSARVFDLNKWYAQNGMNRKIVCVKKEVIKVNGRKAWVADYYKLEVTV
jgi:hypothetical protein